MNATEANLLAWVKREGLWEATGASGTVYSIATGCSPKTMILCLDGVASTLGYVSDCMARAEEIEERHVKVAALKVKEKDCIASGDQSRAFFYARSIDAVLVAPYRL